MNNFMKFDKMITPTIIKIVFWIGIAISILYSLSIIASGLFFRGGGFLVIMGLISLVAGPLLVRIYCELLIIIFKMHETLTDIRESLNHKEERVE